MATKQVRCIQDAGAGAHRQRLGDHLRHDHARRGNARDGPSELPSASKAARGSGGRRWFRGFLGVALFLAARISGSGGVSLFVAIALIAFTVRLTYPRVTLDQRRASWSVFVVRTDNTL